MFIGQLLFSNIFLIRSIPPFVYVSCKSLGLDVLMWILDLFYINGG